MQKLLCEHQVGTQLREHANLFFVFVLFFFPTTQITLFAVKFSEKDKKEPFDEYITNLSSQVTRSNNKPNIIF
jgi:hypothetical protein